MISDSVRADLAPAWARGLALPLLLLLVALLARAQTFGNPVIEFDEQFYRLVGERMMHGAVPYLDIWDRKPIGLFLLYALAAWIGGEGPLPYQFMATLFVAATAWLVQAMARRLSPGWRGPLVAAMLYIFWLNLLQGEGGQASVLENLPVCGAALLVLRQVAGERRGERTLLTDGLLAMLLLGLAAQIKYTMLPAGGLFGLALLWAGRREGLGAARIGGFALGWVAVFALPTLLAWGYYAWIGHGDDWVFANVTSIFLRHAMPLADMLGDLVGGLATMLLLMLAAWLGWRRMEAGNVVARFALCWAGVTLLMIFGMRSFVPHYWIPLVPPLALLAAPMLQSMRRLGIGLAVIAALAGQALVGFFIWSKGDARTVAHMVAAIGPVPHCLFVFDGFPALYQATGSCLPGRYLFPSHLNGVTEKDALRIDPVAEVARIMAAQPDAVVIDKPVWSQSSPQANAIVARALAASYDRVLVEPTGKGRWRIVYRIRPAAARH